MTRTAIEADRSQQNTLLFIHIPKAAGTTLDAIIARQYPASSIFRISGTYNEYERVALFKGLPEDERRKVLVIVGHQLFGLHHYTVRPATYVTVMRNPVDRVISAYYYVLRDKTHYLHSVVHSRKMSLLDYITSDMSPEVSNGQVRLLCGIPSIECGDAPATSETLELCKQNIENHFSAVGLAERFDESLLLFKSLFGWRNVYYASRNKSFNRPTTNSLSPKIIAEIEVRNLLDIELYAYVKQRFEKQIQQMGQAFADDLRQFQRKNKIYAPIFYYYDMLVQFVRRATLQSG